MALPELQFQEKRDKYDKCSSPRIAKRTPVDMRRAAAAFGIVDVADAVEITAEEVKVGLAVAPIEVRREMKLVLVVPNRVFSLG